jgi:hypothetical protein
MPEIIKDNEETSSKDVDSKKLEGDLKSIQTEQKKKSILAKLSDFFRGRAAKESEYPKATQDDLGKDPRTQAIESFTDESGRVRGSIEEHRAEEQRIVAERAQSGQADLADDEMQIESYLRKRAIAELELENMYVKGGPEAIESKMREIEARDRTAEQKPLSVERVSHRYEKQKEQTDNDNSNESKAS